VVAHGVPAEVLIHRRARRSADAEDAVDDLLLSQVIWHSVRGADSPMPAPVRAAFVRTRPAVDDDD